MKSRIFNYQNYSDIDNLLKDYILSVTNKTDITQISLPTINTYLTELDKFCVEKETVE
jgi:hypothetical protein